MIKLRSIKLKLSQAFQILSMMKDDMVDGDGNPLTADACQAVLDSASSEVKETMTVIAVAQMVVKDTSPVCVFFVVQNKIAPTKNKIEELIVFWCQGS